MIWSRRRVEAKTEWMNESIPSSQIIVSLVTNSKGTSFPSSRFLTKVPSVKGTSFINQSIEFLLARVNEVTFLKEGAVTENWVSEGKSNCLKE